MKNISHPPLSRVGLGCMGLSWAYQDHRIDHPKKIEFLRDAVTLGVSFFDTSDQYGPFTNEELLGQALEPFRSQVSLATKGGLLVDSTGKTTRNGTPEHLSQAFKASLRRLRTSYVDLYQLHRVDPEVPIERSWEALAEMAEQGLTRSLGLSEVTVAEIQRAQSIYPVSSVQSELSLWSRDALNEVVPYCAENEIDFIAFAPLGRGFLSGALASPDDLQAGDWRRNHPRYQAETMAENAALLTVMRECSEEMGQTPAQIALAWVLEQGEHVSVIPGTQRRHYLEENLAAAQISLDPAWHMRLEKLPVAAGTRN